MSAARSLRLRAFAEWPEVDREAWMEAQASPYATALGPGAIALAAEGYGRWIAVLASLECLGTIAHPVDRVTQDAVQAYVEVLRGAGNKPRTILTRLAQLAAALRLLAPERSLPWLRPSRFVGEPARARRERTGAALLRAWPDRDRQLWQEGIQEGDILAGPRYAAGLSPRTVDKFAAGYRGWLAFLKAQDLLDPECEPAARVTRTTVAAYVRALQESQRNTSLVARVTELRGAMQVMHPNQDFHWLTAPGGRALSSLFPAVQRPIRSFDSAFLYQWGHTMMQDALANLQPQKRRIAYRNGLLIAVFAARAPRVRSMASLRLGQTVLPDGRRFRLVLERDAVKTGRPIDYHAPASLSAAIAHYVEVIRPELLAGQGHDWFWVDADGGAMPAARIGDMIQRQSKRSFGTTFGPHRFRHALGTTAPLVDPAHPGVAGAILGISGRMVEEHYNRASQADVAHRFHASLLDDRKQLEALARRAFRRC